MKVTNQNLLKSPPQHLEEAKKLNSTIFTRDKRKAAVLVCLFLWFSYVPVLSTTPEDPNKGQWKFDEASQKAYALALNLQLDEVYGLLPSPETAQEHYVVSLSEALELLITEDIEKFKEYEDRFFKRLDRKTRTHIPDDLFLQAEIRMQWTFIYLKFGHEFDAALNVREAYRTITVIKEKFPSFKAVRKTSGLLEVMIGSVPQKYTWVLNLLGMEGSTTTGLSELESLFSSEEFNFEAHLIHALIQGYLLQQPDQAMNELNGLLAKYENNRLALFVASALAIKNARSEAALNLLDSLEKQNQGFPIYFTNYLQGEIYLYKGDYLNAISSYRWFVNHYRGQNCMKDAHYKIGLCYWLNGNINDAQAAFKQAKTVGREASEADKHAAKSLAETDFPHVQLTKARYAIDGGYYHRAKQILDSMVFSNLSRKRDRVEYHYRSARLAHKLNDIPVAKHHYLKSIDLNGEEGWYFAPNACLQMGYILSAEGDLTLAKNYFNKALSYNKHEYKNSIDSKAKSAIAQIKRK
jgi:tetratricopeptide (TPR) repeat protein